VGDNRIGKVEWYRDRAAECAEAARTAVDLRIKVFNEAEAQRWLRLAEAMAASVPGDRAADGSPVTR
jgi:hypothetical protein